MIAGLALLALAALFPPGRALAADLPEPYPALLQEAREMTTLDHIMPMRIFNLASRFADAPDPELTARLIDTELTHSPGLYGFARRVGYTALRFMASSDFASIDVGEVIMRGLDDPVPWVRYDAVWAGEAIGLDTPAFRAKLAELAQGLDPADYESVPPSDALKQVQRRAGRLLQMLSNAR